jgi:hypothetical protein
VTLHRLPDATGLRVLHVEHPRAAPADMYFDANGRLVALVDTVPSPEDASPIRQRFDFEGDIQAGGVHCPRTLRILQNDAPYFELRLASLAVSPQSDSAP